MTSTVLLVRVGGQASSLNQEPPRAFRPGSVSYLLQAITLEGSLFVPSCLLHAANISKDVTAYGYLWACRLDLCDFHKTWPARLPTLLRKNLV
jgi:hypothetical protein